MENANQHQRESGTAHSFRTAFNPKSRQKGKSNMQSIQYSTEHYTDRGHFAVMTRTTVLKDAQLARIADHLRRNAEDLVSASNPPSLHDCRIAGAMLGFAFTLAPLRIEAKFDR